MENRLFDLTGMTALVTGAAGGIGSAISHALARQGARLALSGTNPGKLEAFRDELVAPMGRTMSRGPASNAEQVEKLVPSALAALGKIDILVNNAGITRDNLAMRMKDEEWDAVIRVNLEAAFRLMRSATKPMMKARFGRIIRSPASWARRAIRVRSTMRRPRPAWSACRRASRRNWPAAMSPSTAWRPASSAPR
jgi:3-oxoacyl-[acyl-carrier protein] reductase